MDSVREELDLIRLECGATTPVYEKDSAGANFRWENLSGLDELCENGEGELATGMQDDTSERTKLDSASEFEFDSGRLEQATEQEKLSNQDIRRSTAGVQGTVGRTRDTKNVVAHSHTSRTPATVISHSNAYVPMVGDPYRLDPFPNSKKNTTPDEWQKVLEKYIKFPKTSLERDREELLEQTQIYDASDAETEVDAYVIGRDRIENQIIARARLAREYELKEAERR